jgi:hypothetical protein
MGYMRFAFCLGFAFVAATPVLAAPVIYTCQLDVPASQGWVPEQVVIRYDAADKSVVVNDPLIQHFVGEPVAGRVKTNNASRITFAWDLEMVKNQDGQIAPKFLYRATVSKADNSIRISAIPAGYSNTFEAGGTCSLQ